MKHDELPEDHSDPLLKVLHRFIRFAVKTFSVLMVLVILWGIADVIYVVYEKLFILPPIFIPDAEDILQTFGVVMLVLIAVEIFINIRLYLGSGIIPVELVSATALMAVAVKLSYSI
jgi:uncharacterized membrane protein (DUF373 family)